MNGDRHAATLTDGELAWLLAAGRPLLGAGSPLLPFAAIQPSADEASLRERGVAGESWASALAVLAAPDRQIRTITPGPSETLIQVFYGGRSQPAAGLVGFWLDGDRVRVSFPWEEDDVAAASAQVVLTTPPPVVDVPEATLSVAALQALAGSVDAVRDRLFTSLHERNPAAEYRFAPADLRHQLEAGVENGDARWLVTLLRILAPPYIDISAESAEAGLTELAAAGMVSTDNGRWAPQQPLLTLASLWRSPLPAVAHEVTETVDGEVRRYDHRITIRGDGPLIVVDYQDLLSGAPTVSITTIDALEYLDAVTDLLQPADLEHTAEWVYVLDPVEVRGLHDTGVVAGTLQPGNWYVLVSEDDGWGRVADADGNLEGWAPAAPLRRQSDVPEPELETEAEAEPERAAEPGSPAPPPTSAVARFVVPAEGARGWAAPDPAAPVTTTLTPGLGLEVVERRGDWAQVRTADGWEGWVDGRQLAPAAAPTAAQPPPAASSAAATAPLRQASTYARLRPIPLIAALAVLLSAFAPWVGETNNAFDLPAAFLWNLEPADSSFSLGTLLLLVAAVVAAVVILSPLTRYQWIAGSVVIALGALFLIQLLRTLVDYQGDFVDGLGDMFSWAFAVGPWIALAAGVALLVKR